MQPSHSDPPPRANKIFSLATIVVVVAVLVALIIPSVRSFMDKGHLARNLGRGRQLYFSLRNYAVELKHGGRFPTFVDDEKGHALFENSNQALAVLLPRYLDDRGPLFGPQSAWCNHPEKRNANPDLVLPGENDWAYVRGLIETGNSRWPLLANAFAPGTTFYVADPSKPGGVWKGVHAIVILAGGSGELIETKKSGDLFFVPRKDKPEANAFEGDGEWLAGEHVKVLLPILPQGSGE